MDNLEKKDESPVAVRVKVTFGPRIGKTCVCPVCNVRQPFKKRKVISEPLKI